MSISDVQKMFPDDKTILEYIFNKRYKSCPCGSTSFFQRKRHFTCKECLKAIYPTSGTIFHGSKTPLTKWIMAVYLISQSKNGISSLELQRHLGVTYKTAWRMATLIRSRMKQGSDLLTGTVEMDETYFGGKTNGYKDMFKSKVMLVGMVERGGRVRAFCAPNRETGTLLNLAKGNIERGSKLMTDEYTVYKKTPKLGYQWASVKHGKGHYVRGEVHTNTIEGFWGGFKRSMKGTRHSLGKKYVQSYLDEFVFKYNLRGENIFSALLERTIGGRRLQIQSEELEVSFSLRLLGQKL
ncbi:MAG TPA: IS1595 family transposase [bacterium]|nr:IS1595 family transposase [bacterium]